MGPLRFSIYLGVSVGGNFYSIGQFSMVLESTDQSRSRFSHCQCWPSSYSIFPVNWNSPNRTGFDLLIADRVTHFENQTSAVLRVPRVRQSIMDHPKSSFHQKIKAECFINDLRTPFIATIRSSATRDLCSCLHHELNNPTPTQLRRHTSLDLLHFLLKDEERPSDRFNKPPTFF